MAHAKGAKEKANEEEIGFCFHLSILDLIPPEASGSFALPHRSSTFDL
jgi:hypothetical protein